MSKKSFLRLGDRVSFRGRAIGRIDFHLHDTKVLVRETTGLVRCYPVDALELVERRHEEEPADDEEEEPPACPTRGKLEEAVEILESLMLRIRNGAALDRLHALVSSALGDFFAADGDTAGAVELAADPLLTKLVDAPPF
jgi:hypothetical protein